MSHQTPKTCPHPDDWIKAVVLSGTRHFHRADTDVRKHNVIVNYSTPVGLGSTSKPWPMLAALTLMHLHDILMQ